MTYAWTNGSHIKIDAQATGSFLQQLQRENGERLTARIVLDASRDPSAPTHGHFEWDDQRAAELHREAQARHLITCIRVVHTEGDKQTHRRVFVNVVEQVGDDKQRGYVPLAKVLSDAELFRQVLQQAVADLRAFEDRYAQFQQIADVGHAAAERLGALKFEQQATA